MAVSRFLQKTFSAFKGLDLRSSDLTRSAEFASSMKNAAYNGTNAIVKRKGYQFKAADQGGEGLAVYKDINTSTGAVTETIVTLDDNLYEIVDDSFNVTYSGSGTALLNIGVNSAGTALELTIEEDETVLLTQTLGLGLDEASATTIATVITAIDALTDFAASGGTDTTGSAAFLDLQNLTVLSSTATAINYKTLSVVNTPTSNPLSTTQSNRNNVDFEPASFANMNNCLYVSTSYDNMHKYDGQTFYRAGVPAGGDADGSGDTGIAPTLADAGSGSTFTTGDDYFYMYTYIQVDNKGNRVEGVRSPYSSKLTKAASDDTNVTVTNIESSSGFNTGCAIVNGAQNAVTTITVDSGHTLNTGDTAYFYDGNTSAYVTKTITGTTATSISFSGSVDVANNAVISNNLRIGIYRTQEIGAATDATLQTYYLVAEIPNDSIGTATQVYVDQTTDANLGAQYIVPIKAPNLPPKGRYMTAFRNQLFIGGDPENVNTVYYSDINQPEYWATAVNSFLVDAFEGSKVRGLGALDTAVIVFKDRSIQTVTGDIALDNFRVDEISYGGIGCAAHASIQPILGSLFFLSEKGGVYAVNLEGVSEIGRRISPRFTAFDVAFNLQKATAVHWINQDKYLLFVPEESQDGSSNDYANADSRIFAYDYVRDAWLEWTNVNAMGGMVFTDDKLYFQSKRLDSDSSAVEAPLAVFNNYGSSIDYNDHQSAVDFEYKTHWEALGDPALFKRFLRLKVFALESDVLDGEASLSTLTIDQEFNFITPAAISTFTMDFSGGAAGYGESEYGTAPYGDSPLSEISGKLKSVKCRSMRLIFRNNTQSEDILISGYELEVAPSYIPQMKE